MPRIKINNSSINRLPLTVSGQRLYLDRWPGFFDLASDSYNAQFALLLSETDQALLRQLEEAMQKIKDGQYGSCISCGGEIPEKRLEAVPWARHCLKCQELEEKGFG